MSIEEQNNILLHFYMSTCGSILPAVSSASSSLPTDAQSSLHSSLTHKPVETYTIHEVYTVVYKCMHIMYTNTLFFTGTAILSQTVSVGVQMLCFSAGRI